MNNRKILIVTLPLLFCLYRPGTPESLSLEKTSTALTDYESKWKDYAARAILALVETTETERSTIASKYAYRTEYAFKFFKKRKTFQESKAIYENKLQELNAINFNEQINDIKDKIKAINSAFIKIELLSMPIYTYATQEHTKKIKTDFTSINPITFLTPCDVLDLRILVLKDILELKTISSEKDIKNIVLKHFKPMATEKIKYIALEKDKILKFLKVKIDIVGNADLYTQNSLWFDNYLVTLAKYNKSTRTKESSPGETGTQTTTFDTTTLGEALAMEDFQRNSLQIETLSNFKKQLSEDFKKLEEQYKLELNNAKDDDKKKAVKEKFLADAKKLQLKISKIDYSLINARERASKEPAIEQINIENVKKVLADFCILHESAVQKLNVVFSDEYYITLFKQILVGAELTFLGVAPICLAFYFMGLTYSSLNQITKLLENESSLQTAVDYAKIHIDNLITSLNLKLPYYTMSDELHRMHEYISTYNPYYKDNAYFKSYLNAIVNDFNKTGFVTTQEYAETISKLKQLDGTQRHQFIKLSDQITQLGTKYMRSSELANKFTCISAVGPLLVLVQAALIDHLLTTPNKRRYQKYYAFWELKNNIAMLNSGMRRMIKVGGYKEEEGAEIKTEVGSTPELIPSTEPAKIPETYEERIKEEKEFGIKIAEQSVIKFDLEEFYSLIAYCKENALPSLSGATDIAMEITAIQQMIMDIEKKNKRLQYLYDMYTFITSIKPKPIDGSSAFEVKAYNKNIKKVKKKLDNLKKALGITSSVDIKDEDSRYSLIISLRNTMQQIILTATQNIAKIAPKADALRKICAARELFDFKRNVIGQFTGNKTLSELDDAFKIEKQEVGEKGTHGEEPVKPSKLTASVDYKSILKIEALKKLTYEQKNLIIDRIPGWFKNYTIDWDIYFIHEYLKLTKNKDEDLLNTVSAHLTFPYLPAKYDVLVKTAITTCLV